MEASGGIATWLELVVAPEWRKNSCKIRVHAVGGRDGNCFAISMDHRWLCAAGGALTVFCGHASALHFLKLLRIDDFDSGEPPQNGLRCEGNRCCLCADDAKGLTRCPVSRLAHRYLS
ncbi:hypothetical protein [Aromatoleum sp.]|uniref:hypothetical protein n=1 Tax=Aromatoleum sp. TaxID=2307007 RepID=UPI002FC89996